MKKISTYPVQANGDKREQVLRVLLSVLASQSDVYKFLGFDPKNLSHTANKSFYRVRKRTNLFGIYVDAMQSYIIVSISDGWKVEGKITVYASSKKNHMEDVLDSDLSFTVPLNAYIPLDGSDTDDGIKKNIETVTNILSINKRFQNLRSFQYKRLGKLFWNLAKFYKV